MIDGRKTVFDLKQQIMLKYFDEVLPGPDEMKIQLRLGSRADARFAPEALLLDDSAQINSSGIEDKQTYLCWNGQTIRGKPWDGKTRCTHLEVRPFPPATCWFLTLFNKPIHKHGFSQIVHVRSQTLSDTLRFPVPENVTLLTVKRLIAQKLEVSVEDLIYITFSSSGPNLAHEDDLPLSNTIGDTSRPTIFVEEWKESFVSPLFFSFFLLHFLNEMLCGCRMTFLWSRNFGRFLMTGRSM